MYLQLLKSLNRLHPRAWDFVQLSRMDRPIGIYLLLWPTLSAVWIAGHGSPTLANVLIFGLGVVLMRAAGCCINDFADRKVDGHVKRTADRPLASGRVRSREALAFSPFWWVSASCWCCAPTAVPCGCRSARWRWHPATRS